jgi:hypothetical protein
MPWRQVNVMTERFQFIRCPAALGDLHRAVCAVWHQSLYRLQVAATGRAERARFPAGALASTAPLSARDAGCADSSGARGTTASSDLGSAKNCSRSYGARIGGAGMRTCGRGSKRSTKGSGICTLDA